MKNFWDSEFGHYFGIALVVLALFGGVGFTVRACSDAAAACAQAGGSYSGTDGSCEMPGGER